MSRTKINQKTTELSPLHKKLIESFPLIKEELIEKLAPKVGKQTFEIKKMVSNLLLLTSENYDTNNVEINQLIKDTTNLIRELSTQNDLFYRDLPKGWKDYLRESLEEVICSMKNKEELRQIFEVVIEKITFGEKVNFSEIFKDLFGNKSYKFEVTKILSIFEEKYNIAFIKMGGSGFILNIGEYITKDDLKSNIGEIEKVFHRIMDQNGVTKNIIIQSFLNFIKEIILDRNLGEFQQHEFVMYCLENTPEINIGILRTFIKEIFKKLEEQGIVVRKKHKITYEVKFNKMINNLYNYHFFPNLKNDKEGEKRFNEGFDDLEKSTTSKNQKFLLLLKNEFIKLNKRGEFFILSKFLEENKIENKIVFYNATLNALIKNGIIGRKGRERYYIKNEKAENTTDITEILEISNSISKFKIKGKLNHYHNKILYYIFKDLKNIGIDIASLNAKDLEIKINIDGILIIFIDNKFANYQNHILSICDEIGEKKSINIRPIFKNN